MRRSDRPGETADTESPGQPEHEESREKRRGALPAGPAEERRRQAREERQPEDETLARQVGRPRQDPEASVPLEAARSRILDRPEKKDAEKPEQEPEEDVGIAEEVVARQHHRV